MGNRNNFLFKLLSFIVFVVVGFQLISCHIPHDREIICKQNFRYAVKLAYKTPTDTIALDSALILVDRCLRCDSIKNAAVELKLRLLHTLGKCKEGEVFIDSLQTSDFTYPYKKKLYHDSFIATSFQLSKDTIRRNAIFQKMAIDLEEYIKNNKLQTKEFEEAYTDLYSLKDNFVQAIIINREIDSLETKYPDKVKFFEFFRK